MNRYSEFFTSLQADQIILKRHGFESWPDVEDLTRYVFEVVDALGEALSLNFTRDVRGRMVVSRSCGEGGDES